MKVLAPFMTLLHVFAKFALGSAQTIPCPTEPSLMGYTTITALRSGIQAEADLLASGMVDLPDNYQFNLCPDTVFDMDAEGTFLPQLAGTIFIRCGAPPIGFSSNNCTFFGGDSQVRVEDHSIGGFTMDLVQFRGVTFTSFSGTSLTLDSTSGTTRSICRDCIFRDFDAVSVAESVNGLDLRIEDSLVSYGVVSSDLFSNDGGGLTIESTVIEQVVATNFVSTIANGNTVVEESRISSGTAVSSLFLTQDGSVITARNSQVFEMNSMMTVFLTTGQGSSTTLSQFTIRDNTILGGDFVGVASLVGTSTVVTNSRFIRNTGLQAGVAVMSAFGLVRDSDFIENMPSNPSSSGVTALFASDAGGTLNVRRTIIESNGEYDAFLFLRDSSTSSNTLCFLGGEAISHIFIDETSSYTLDDIFAEETTTVLCPLPGPIIFVEDAGSTCFEASDCTGTCDAPGGDTTQCLTDRNPTATPTAMPTPFSMSPVTSPSSLTTPFPTETDNCQVEATEFRAVAVAVARGDSGLLTDAAIEMLETLFVVTYNSLNNADPLCDPFRRRIDEVQVSILPSGLPFPNQDFFFIFFQATGQCQGCSSQSPMFSIPSQTLFDGGSRSLRDAFSMSCPCPGGTDSRAPTAEEFGSAFLIAMEEQLGGSLPIQIINFYEITAPAPSPSSSSSKKGSKGSMSSTEKSKRKSSRASFSIKSLQMMAMKRSGKMVSTRGSSSGKMRRSMRLKGATGSGSSFQADKGTDDPVKGDDPEKKNNTTKVEFKYDFQTKQGTKQKGDREASKKGLNLNLDPGKAAVSDSSDETSKYMMKVMFTYKYNRKQDQIRGRNIRA